MASVLAASFVEHHPTAGVSVLLIDGDERDRGTPGPFDVVLPADLGLDRVVWRTMAAMYSVTEFATALKPALLRHVLGTEPRGSAVAYLDPDILVLAPFPEVFEAAVADDIVLTPHLLHPMPRDGLSPDEEVFRHAGIFNLGFVCVAHEAAPFLDWWHERLVADAVVDLPHGLFTDQRWVDWVPGLFRHRVLRDPGLNVAYWNAHERGLSSAPDGTITANGSPLRFFHFSGFDPSTPWVLSRHGGPAPRVRMSDAPVVRELCGRYTRLLMAQKFGERMQEYGFDRAAGGQRLTPEVRAAFRREAVAALNGSDAWPPDPFDPASGDELQHWLTEEVAGTPSAGFTRWELALYRSRPDIQGAFPDLDGVHAAHYRRWLEMEAHMVTLRRQITGLDEPHHGQPFAQHPATEEGGVDLIGYLAGELGVGEAARRMAAAVQLTGMPSRLVGVHAAGARHDQPVSQVVHRHLHHRDRIYCTNADETPRVIARLEGEGATRGDARRFALWFWELASFPESYARAFDLLDEVWVTSEFTRAAVAAAAPIPVRHIPLPVTAPGRPSPFTRRQLAMPDRFVFATALDFHSVARRKNPDDLVDAYTRAFGPDDGAHLLVKSINGAAHVADLERLRWLIGDRTDVTLIDDHWSMHQMQALRELCDCFVSLHRSEGFGLNLADAMAVGTPVIATGYSGNTEFMTSANSYVVPYELVDVGDDAWPYLATSQWAQPDVDVAARMMREVFEDPGEARARAALGRAQVLAAHSPARAASAIAAALAGQAVVHDPAAVGA